MKVLVVNCGSSSVKYTLFDMDGEKKIAWGIIECIGLPEAYYKRQTSGTEEKKDSVKVTNHTEAVELIIKNLLDKKTGSINNIDEISVVGHRIVHGGEKFSKPVLVTPEVKEGLKSCFAIAPLHNPAHYAGIVAVEKMLPGIPSVLVFDTAFHQTMPDYAYMYALPYELYEKDHIRKYGFHGTSHNYVSQRAAAMLGKPIGELNLITAHLGNGSSITAIQKGKVIDTSMGFTPLPGVVMGTRCGDIDPAIIAYLMDEYPQYRDGATINNLMNKKSGLYGISGLSGDMRTIVKAVAAGNKKAKLAFDMLTYSVKKYISSYFGLLNGIDALVFTAGIGENSPSVREKICENLSALGIEMDVAENNEPSGEERVVSTAKSKVKILIIPTNEELMIARESKKVLSNG
ncbi:acetate/propionate family kinase [Endomicrobium proavitum]|uniref:Acetate kinase n=1 Tax=Endomicrobium proavitum TaxID=1408281 RepID=A0A0G3WGD2_9BACT|nr:acetate kinase [Endomicrobium proavitum]AKL97726.1 Acetate kinase [Endomicrobium proavitum]